MIVAELQPRFVDAGLPAFDVARLLWLSRSAASRLVGRAEQVGLVERSRDVFDQRDVSVGITTHGRSVVHRLDAVLRASARAIGLDDDELQRLADLVGRIARRYERI